MYLARRRHRGRWRYSIRESVRVPESDALTCRELFDLGENPGRYVVYPGSNAFYIDGIIEDNIAKHGVSVSYEELEDLMWSFIDPELRYKAEAFRGRSSVLKQLKGKASDEELQRVHLFDKRRLYYLRCGHKDQSNLCRITNRLYKQLTGKSRDELEQFFLNLEEDLRQQELKVYVHVIFDLQKHFPNWMFAKTRPETLNPEKLGAAFEKEFHSLQEDQLFRAGFSRDAIFREYLMRYADMFHDHEFGHYSYDEEFIRTFINSRRQHSPPRRAQKVEPEDAENLFKVPFPELKQLKKQQLTRLYRARAKEIHPDIGGEHDEFIKLTEMYETLLAGAH